MTDLPQRSTRTRVLVIATAGTLAVTAYAALGAVQILWLNPRAAVPGLALTEIADEVAAAGESLGTPSVIAAMSLGPLLALGVLIRAAVRTTVTPRGALLQYLGLLALGAFVYFAASFGPGMALADTFGISGADYSPWAGPLYLTSLASILALIAIAVDGVLRRRSEPGHNVSTSFR